MLRNCYPLRMGISISMALGIVSLGLFLAVALAS